MYEVEYAIGLQDDCLILPGIVALATVDWSSRKFTGVQVRTAAELCFSASKMTKARTASPDPDMAPGDALSSVPDGVMLAFKFLGHSPNFNTGGAMAFMFEEMQ